MADELQSRLQSIQSKARLLTERYALLMHRNRQLDDEVQQLQHTVRKQQEQIAVLEQQLEHMRVVSPLAMRAEDVERSRTVLNQLVRDIDKCIAELTD